MSVLSTIETDFGKVAHAFVIGAEKLKAVIVGAAKEIVKDGSAIAQAETVANAVISEIYPGAEVVAKAIEAGMARAFEAVAALGDAAAANGLSVQLDTAAIDAIKAALPIVQKQAATIPGS